MNHRIRLFTRCICVAALALLATSGCSGAPQLGDVTGTVTLEGKPLSGVQVVFSPDVGKDDDGRSSIAITDQSGSYHLQFDDRKSPRPGAIVGKHKIILVDIAWEDARDDPKRGPKRIPENYSVFGSTPLEVEVKPGTQSIPIEIKPK
jgi:hypothetical protein